jgi:phosphoinositide-3-kinase regulatory subunit 4
VKPENVMVTSWNWVFLTDFASFKPTFLPADNDVSLLFYYFEPVKNRSRCCLAPERFVRVQVCAFFE